MSNNCGIKYSTTVLAAKSDEFAPEQFGKSELNYSHVLKKYV